MLLQSLTVIAYCPSEHLKCSFTHSFWLAVFHAFALHLTTMLLKFLICKISFFLLVLLIFLQPP